MGGAGKEGPKGSSEGSPHPAGEPPRDEAPPTPEDAPGGTVPPDSSTDPDRPAPGLERTSGGIRPTSRHEPGPIFVCDASAEAERLMTSLRNRGYSAVDVPLGMLPGRVRYELPSLVVCDADAHEALLRIKEMRAAAPDEVLLLFVGHDDGALSQEAEMRELATATLVRPLNLSATVDLVQSIVGSPPDKPEKGSRGPRRKRPALIVASARKPYRSDVVGADRSLSSSRPPEGRTYSAPPSVRSVAPMSEPVPALSESGPPSPASSVPPSSGETKLSAETRSLLDEGRRRMAGHPLQAAPHVHSRASEDQGTPAEGLLEALREPLDRIDESLEGPSSGAEGTGGAESKEESTGMDEVSAAEGPISEDAQPASVSPSTDQGDVKGETPPPSSSTSQSTVPPGVIFSNAKPSNASDPPAEPRSGREYASSASDAPSSADASIPPELSMTPWPVRPSNLADAPRTEELSATSERVGGPIPERHADSSAPSSDAATLAPPRRTDSRGPDSDDAVEGDDQTNPGGRLPTQRPGSGAPTDSLRGILPQAPSRAPPPLDDLSDLLTGAPDDAFEPVPTPAPPTMSTSRTTPRGPADRTFAGSFAGHSSGSERTSGEDRTDAVGAIGQAIRERRTGSLAQEDGGGVRRLVIREGDMLTATSSREDESLTRYLAERGDITAETANSLRPIPHFGRHAGAALIARGVLRQEELWPVLRAHAEWLLGKILMSKEAVIWEARAPVRVSEEPAVFGGAAGAEIFLDLIGRVVDARSAFRLLGSGKLRLGRGVNEALLGESALDPSLERRALSAAGSDLSLLLEREPDLLPILLGLTELGVLSAGGSIRQSRSEGQEQSVQARSVDMDERAFADRVSARRALVDRGDYFTLLGIGRMATGPEVDRAKEQLYRELSPAQLSPKTAHLRDDIELILQMVDEAHLVLRDDVMRSRYRKALEDSPGLSSDSR